MRSVFPFRVILFLGCCYLLPVGLVAQQDLNKEIDKLLQNWTYLHSNNKYDRAIRQAEKAFTLAEQLKDKGLMATALHKEALSYIKQPKRLKKNRKLAKEKFEKSLFLLATTSNQEDLRIDNLEQLLALATLEGEQELILVYNNQITEIKKMIKTSATSQALVENKVVLESKIDKLATQRKALSKKVKSLTEAQLESELLIALQKNQVDSFRFESIKDSFLLQQKELVLTEQSAKLELQQSHIALQNSQIELQASQRNVSLALMAIISLLAIGTFMRYIETKKHFLELSAKNEIIEAERKKSEQLLLNILPAIVANELKLNGVAKAKKYENATVFFSDFKNFSAIAKSLSPEKLVHELDFYFKAFDQIIGKYQIEKIKTIGDAYMCVGGLPEENKTNSLEVVKAALEIQAYLSQLKEERIAKGEPYFEARIGIHTGPLVAGVVGSSKFAYDIWGDTVNVAARLESKSEVGKVNISATTYDLIKNRYACESRGRIPVKNRGEVEMYFVEKPLLAAS